VSEIRRGVREEDGNHGRIDDIDGVVKHRHYKTNDEWGGKFSSFVAREDMRGRQWLRERRKSLPANEGHEDSESANQGSDDFGIGGRESGGIYDANKNEGGGENEQKSTDVIELFERLLEW
jgi:hypothetical protein